MANPLKVVLTDSSGAVLATFPVTSEPQKAATGAETNVASSATDVTILAANTNRLGFSVFNDSTAILYILLANAVSSATLHTAQVGPGALYAPPAGVLYTGVVKGLWASAAGSARVTEWTA